eukprot:TRINITY_DN14837_c0_g1_i1.p1 TRINITY_DN14837_c0_g1~~TRINITY_DN14837_c0_g1_i1.p1  ORF type:complete len:126 (+),score=12.60 TRINITY_DN14837_c0_g1_i1:396-773(+)
MLCNQLCCGIELQNEAKPGAASKHSAAVAAAARMRELQSFHVATTGTSHPLQQSARAIEVRPHGREQGYRLRASAGVSASLRTASQRQLRVLLMATARCDVPLPIAGAAADVALLSSTQPQLGST